MISIVPKDMVRGKNEVTKRMFHLFAFVGLILSLTFLISAGDVNAGIIKIGSRKDTDSTVKITVKGKGADKINVDYFEFTKEGSGKSNNKTIKFKKNKSTGNFEATYKMGKGEYGTYELSVVLLSETGEWLDGDYVTFEYKSKETDTVKVSKVSGSIDLPGIGSFHNNFFTIDKGSGEIRHIKTGETVTVKVLYKRGSSKKIKGSIYLMWGSKRIEPATVYEESSADPTTGYYYTGAKYTLSSSTDLEGKLVTYYPETAGKMGSTSLGITLDADGTSPKITVEKEFRKGDSHYYKDDVTIPITIEEKNFDESKTTVTVNGKKVSTSWSKSGSSNKANIKLEEGKSEVVINSTDAVGNVADEVKLPVIIVDKQKPTVKIEGFENGTGKGLVNGEYQAFPFKISISDNELLGEVSVEFAIIDENSGASIPMEMVLADGDTRKEYSLQDLTEDGYYTVAISVKDKAGNEVEPEGVESEGTNPYSVEDGVVKGGFTVNREGSLYMIENNAIFEKPINEPQDIVIYEYNKNRIESHSVAITSSVETRELSQEEYLFEELDTDNPKYKFMYRYTIYKTVFSEGTYNVKINSTSIAGDNGSLIARTEESNNLDKQMIIDMTAPEVVNFYGTTGGEVKVKVRDNNIDEASVYLELDGEKYQLAKDEDDSTSTNMIFICDIKKNPEGAKVICSDLAGNNTESTALELKEESNLEAIIIYALLGAGGIAILVGAIVIIVLVRRKK